MFEVAKKSRTSWRSMGDLRRDGSVRMRTKVGVLNLSKVVKIDVLLILFSGQHPSPACKTMFHKT
jgi:hypothetical protein